MEREVIISGAGPAGAICASYLAKEGVDVLLLDKAVFPRDKACGDMQQEGFVSHVEKLGAFEKLDEMACCIRNIKLVSDKGSEAVLPYEFYATPRYELDVLLLETAIGWGAEVRQDSRLTDVISSGGAVRGVRVRNGGEEAEIKCRLFIGADGACSASAKALGVMREGPEGFSIAQRAYFKGVDLDRSLAKGRYDGYGIFYFDSSVRPGYFWIIPSGRRGVEEGFCNVGMVVRDRDSYRAPDLQERFFRWLEKSPAVGRMFENADQTAPWAGGKIPDLRQNIENCGNGYIFAGDAAAVMEPVLDDGLSSAADSAAAAAGAALKAFEKNDFSGDHLRAVYSSLMKKTDGSAGGRSVKEEDIIKERKLLIQSMYDPDVMDMTVRKLAEDPPYRKRVMGGMFDYSG